MTQSRTNSTQNVKTQPEVEQDNYMTDRTRCGLRLKHDMVNHTRYSSKKTRQNYDMIDCIRSSLRLKQDMVDHT